MNLASLYGETQPPTQAPSQPISTANTQAVPAVPDMSHRNVAVSWIGIVVALGLLRAIWEIAG